MSKYAELMEILDRTVKIQEETSRKLEKWSKRSAEMDVKLKENRAELDRELKENRAKLDLELKQQFAETDRRIDKRMNQIQGLFTSQWGRLIESLVKGDLIRILNERGIKVEDTSERTKGSHQGENYEYDIIAHDGKEIVIVEVKTTLKPQDIKDFREKLEKAKTYMERYEDNVIYGAVAFLQADAGAEVMAEKNGLFVIRATGDSAAIINHTDFDPKKF